MVWVDGLFFGCGSGGLSSVPIVVSFEERTIGAERKSLLRPEVVESAYKVSLRHSMSLLCEKMSLLREEIVLGI